MKVFTSLIIFKDIKLIASPLIPKRTKLASLLICVSKILRENMFKEIKIHAQISYYAESRDNNERERRISKSYSIFDEGLKEKIFAHTKSRES